MSAVLRSVFIYTYGRNQLRPNTTVNVIDDGLRILADQQHQDLFFVRHPRTEKNLTQVRDFSLALGDTQKKVPDAVDQHRFLIHHSSHLL